MNKSHLFPPKIQLFGYRICPYVLRVRYVLALLDLQYDYIEVDVYKTKPDALLRYSSSGRVPTLAIDNEAICDSTVISLWLSQVYSEHNLLPLNAWSKALIMNDMAAIDIVHKLIGNIMYSSDKDEFNAATNALRESLAPIISVLIKPNFQCSSLLDVWAVALVHLLKTLDKLLSNELSNLIPSIRMIPDIYLNRQFAVPQYKTLVPDDYSQQLKLLITKHSTYCTKLMAAHTEKECLV
ncbi:glutathione S-transferase family protein [Pseudoalteromonas rhizosphaerae]|uniref:Glutathione S-transferase family protein n=1 Tax=Pseudoalteromonas rhizosphaerae TaxID=2518973 RepID=A0ABW8L1P8_9GAMM